MSAFTNFINNMRTRRDPAEDGFPVTPNDNTDLPNGNCRGFHVGGDGDVELISPNGNTVVYKSCIAGMQYPYEAARIKATNTTATDIVALY